MYILKHSNPISTIVDCYVQLGQANVSPSGGGQVWMVPAGLTQLYVQSNSGGLDNFVKIKIWEGG